MGFYFQYHIVLTILFQMYGENVTVLSNPLVSSIAKPRKIKQWGLNWRWPENDEMMTSDQKL